MNELDKKIAGIITPWGDGLVNQTDLALNYNNIPFHSDTAIIVTSWWGHLIWLRNTLKNYRLTGKFVICAYDVPYHPWTNLHNEARFMPSPKIMIFAHNWVFKHMTFDSKKRDGWFWDVYLAKGIVSNFDNFKYIFTVNGDCIWEKPENVNELIKLLGDNDIMSVSRERETIHTCAVLYKRDAFLSIFDYMAVKHKTPIIGSYQPEKMLNEAVNYLKLKEMVVPKQPMEPDGSSVDHYSRYSQNSTWKEIVGYRNLYAEHATAGVEGKEPIDKKYFDMEYVERVLPGAEQESLLKYYETGDRRYIHMFWDRNETSWYDRVNHPVEWYGDKPIYEK